MNDFLTGRPLEPYYRALAPRPDAEYGSILPFAYNAPGSPTWAREGSNLRFALPEFARSAMRGFLDLLQGTETGKLTPEALETITLGSLGAGGALAPRGALAAGGAIPREWWRRPDLTLARAHAMGFRPELRLYHGTDADFPAFVRNPPATTLGLPPVGIWTTRNPDFAARFPVRLDASTGRPIPGHEMPGHQILPLMARWERLAEAKLRGNEGRFSITGAVMDAWDSGHDALRFLKSAPGQDVGLHETWVFRDPNQLRSPFAKFDPARRDSSDLMAGFAAPGPTPVPGLHAWRLPESTPPGMIRLPTGQVVDESVIPNHLRPPGRQVY
jgi:hypothetical protein